MFRLFIILTSLILSSISKAHDEKICGESQMGQQAYKWCIYQYSSTPSQNVLYYMHGGGGSEQTWGSGNIFADIRAAIKKSGRTLPTVISISFGPQWLLSDVARSKGSSLFKTVVNDIMPNLEAKLTKKTDSKIFNGRINGRV